MNAVGMKTADRTSAMATTGPADFVHRVARGLARRLAQLEVPLDVLDHDDRVVHDDADREHQPEQREVVQREAERREHGERADQRHGNRRERDDRRAPVLEEHDHDQDDQQDGLEHGLLHGGDRLHDELRRVVADLALEARGKALAELVEGGLDGLGGGDRIRAGSLAQQDRDRRAAVVEAVGVVLPTAELDARDVLDAHHPSVGAALDDDVAELLGLDEAALRVDDDLEVVAAGHRRLGELARGHLHVLGSQRLDDLGPREAERLDPLGVEPDAHAVLARAVELHVADAVDARQLVLHLQGRVVADVELVVDAVLGVEEGDHQQVGRLLLRGDAEPSDVLGQPRLRDRHAVLRQHLRDVEVGAELEGDRDRGLAVVGGDAVDVEHVLDAVDLLLDRRGDGVGDDLRGRAGIGRANHDGRRHHVGKQRDGQLRVRQRSDEDDRGSRERPRRSAGR